VVICRQLERPEGFSVELLIACSKPSGRFS
jgi:hypothetical protein